MNVALTICFDIIIVVHHELISHACPLTTYLSKQDLYDFLTTEFILQNFLLVIFVK